MTALAATLLLNLTAVPADLANKVQLEPFLRGLSMPVALVPVPGRKDTLFVVEKTGKIRMVTGGKLQPEPVLDVSDRVSRGSEQGLLGIAFHPKYATNGRYYINYTDKAGDTHVVEIPGSRDLLTVDQPYSNHNGGHLALGPDGKLWVGLGDGGAGYDPEKRGQDRGSLLGKMLLLDVDAAKPTPVMHMIGLRNPWRYAFDRATGDLYIADVGQDRWEEVDVLSAKDALAGGQNFGWGLVEGDGHCPRGGSCKPPGMVPPVVEYDHKTGCSITGGFVYRGKAFPELTGAYFYADYCTAIVRSFRWKDGKVTDEWNWKPVIDPNGRLSQISSFGEDADGELYILSLDGSIWKLTRRAAK